MTKKMQELCNKRADLQRKGDALVAENKLEELENVNNELENLDREIAALEKFENSAKSVETETVTSAKKGFATFAEQLRAIKVAGETNERVVDERLVKNAVSGGANTGNNADGGYAIQPDFLPPILDRAFAKSDIANRCKVMTITGNKNRADWVQPDDADDATKSGIVVAGGVTAGWVKEGETVLKSKPAFKNREAKLGKIMGIAYVTEEMLEDVDFMGQFLEDSFGDAVGGVLTEGILNGNGTRSGQPTEPEGIMNSNALVTVTASSTTLAVADLLNMKARMTKKAWANAVWVMHPDLEASLPLLNTADKLVYMPEGGISGVQYDTLLGKPVIYDEYLAPKQTKGDILLADFNQYMLLKKGSERRDWSMHVAFLADEHVFRIVLRVGGAVVNNTAIAVRNSTLKRSAFVTLSARGTKLATPTVTITSNTASWTAITNATGYTYSINGGEEKTITTTSVASIPASATIKVKANGNGTTYVDSDYGTATNGVV